MFPCTSALFALFSLQNSRLGIQWLSHHGNYLAFYFILIHLSLLLSLFMKSTFVAVSKGDNLMYPLHYSSLFRGPMRSISVLYIYPLQGLLWVGDSCYFPMSHTQQVLPFSCLYTDFKGSNQCWNVQKQKTLPNNSWWSNIKH